MNRIYSGSQIRKTFIDFFVERGHTMVPSSSLVPGGDQTLLFTNAGMVQFKDIFLGTDKRAYTRAVNSQKCLRVAGKHNDLEDVGFDDTHHTFFEMLGNWSFGDYYKQEAISWAWQLLTEVWELPKDRLYATCFEDEKGEIEQDDEAANYWRQQPGIDPSHVLFFGRKDNFWEMAENGPCGPCSEIHFDRGIHYCDKQDIPGHVCGVNRDCARFLELWNLVFIQYNRSGPSRLEPLPSRHVDTGMGIERIVSVLQDVKSNYQTDLLSPIMDKIQELAGHSDQERQMNLTPYRVITDHIRAASFLIADGVIPGNTGRNYVCRMIVRRAARFGAKIGLSEPFLAKTAEVVISHYGDFYPELLRNKTTIFDNLTREEIRFQRTLEGGITKLEGTFRKMNETGMKTLPGDQAFDLYATYGLPFEISRDIAREAGLDVDEAGFQLAMDEHRIASGSGEAFGPLGGEDADIFQAVLAQLQSQGLIGPAGVSHNPYQSLQVSGPVLAIFRNGMPVPSAQAGDKVEVILPETCFYIESGGQVSDTGIIASASSRESSQGNNGDHWVIRVMDLRKPAAGVITHVGEVLEGEPRVGDGAVARVDAQRRQDIMRNHTATHLLHAGLHEVLGKHARQAGSLVSPDRLRFDFTHPDALSPEQLDRIESLVNENILNDLHLKITHKPLQQAIEEGAMALFGEKYAETVRTITIDRTLPEDGPGELSAGSKHLQALSYELCGGTHVDDTGDIGLFIITSESSAAAGIRRIEAVTGRYAYELVKRRLKVLKNTSTILATSPDEVPHKVQDLLDVQATDRKQIASLRSELALNDFNRQMSNIHFVQGIPVLSAKLEDCDADTLRRMTDQFRKQHPGGLVVLASVLEGRPIVVAAIHDDLVRQGFNATDLVKHVAKPLGGGGGGKPTLAQAGGRDASNLDEALQSVEGWVKERLG